MNNLSLWLVSLGWSGLTVWIWIPWAYEMICTAAGLAIGGLAVWCLTPAGQKTVARLFALERPPRSFSWAAGAALCAYLFFFILLKTAQYVTFQGREFVAMYLSMIWNTGSHAFLPNFLLGLQTHLGDHFEPIMAMYWPFAHAVASPWLALTVHNLLVFSSIGILWRLTRVWKLSWPLRYLLVLLYVTNGFFQSDLSALLVPPPLALPIFLLVLWMWETNRALPFAAGCLLLLLVREEAALALMALGAASMCIPERRRQGLWLILGGALAFGGAMWTVSHFQEAVPSKWVRFFGKSETFVDFLRYLVAHPLEGLKMWAWPVDKFSPFLALIVSVGGLVLAFPPAVLALLLLNAPHQASSGGNPHFHSLALYYSSFLLPLAIWGAGRGLAKVWSWKEALRPAILSILLLLVAQGTMSMTPHALFLRLSPSRLRAGWAGIQRVRPEDAVWCSVAFAPPLAFRKRLQIYAGDMRDATWVPDVILADEQELARMGPAAGAELAEFVRRHGFALESADQGVLLFRRPPPTR